jgi:hypothetical protein
MRIKDNLISSQMTTVKVIKKAVKNQDQRVNKTLHNLIAFSQLNRKNEVPSNSIYSISF